MKAPSTVPHAETARPRFVAASPEDIRYAEELRRRIQQRYLAPAEKPSDPYWCVGAD